MMTIGIELKKYRKQMRMTLPEIASRLNVSTTTIVNYETGKRVPEIDFLADFAALSGMDFLHWLDLRLSASNSANASAARERIHETLARAPETQSFVSLPLLKIGEVFGATSNPVSVHITDEIPQFSRSWIERELNATPDDLCLVPVDDDSMTPTLRPGDTILLDRRAARPDREGIYIIRMNEVSLIKRLQIMPDGLIKISGDNPAYATFTVNLGEIHNGSISILGRVVWVIWAGRRI
ncbi:MAG TPA: LexA family transcriptional regulator [Gallionella sp.]